jgi:hypothetical protein
MDTWPLGKPFSCNAHIPAPVAQFYRSFTFTDPAILSKMEEPGPLYFYSDGFITSLTSCMDCGPLHGSLCDGRIPMLRIPAAVFPLIAPADPSGYSVFFCRQHMQGAPRPPAHRTWTVMTPPHTLSLASMIAEALRTHDFDVELTTSQPTSYDRDMYVVVCVHAFPQLPPPSKRIAVQLEQASSNWLNKAAMRESYALLEYNFDNIQFLASEGIKDNVWYMPLGGNPALLDTASPDKEFDIIFYGDMRSPRRQMMLAVLETICRLKVLSTTYGPEMTDMIRRAKFVINIHDSIPAQLEVYRILEALSLGVPVISEDAPDRHLYPDLSSVVQFFDFDSMDSMVLA